MIGMVLIAEGFGAHVPKGYIYAAMAFSSGPPDTKRGRMREIIVALLTWKERLFAGRLAGERAR